MADRAPEPAGPLNVGDWLVDGRAGTIQRGDDVVKVRPHAMEVLVHLARHAPEVVSPEQLIERFWSPAVVGDDAVQVVVSELRRALGDDAYNPRYIETVPKRGYRIVASVTEATPHKAKRRNLEFIDDSAYGLKDGILSLPNLPGWGLGLDLKAARRQPECLTLLEA